MKFAFITFLLITACAHHPDPAAISRDEGPDAAITTQEELMSRAHSNHVDVLAPEEYKDAKEQLSEAKDEDQKEDIYEALGISKAYLNRAISKANKRAPQLEEVLTAREAAMKAGENNGALSKADESLVKFTANEEKFDKMDSGDREKLQKKYFDAELVAIKDSKLGEVKRTLAEAKSKGAKKLIPKTYKAAERKFRAAEDAIEADRHADYLSQPAIAAAASSANRALMLVDTARVTQGQTPEERALTLDERNKALMEADEMNADATDEILAKDEALATTGAALSTVASERNALKQRELQDQAIKNAAAQFDPSEAEVYRQGENLVIRLKKVNFASGRSDLPAQSMPVLGKVKDIIKDLGPSAIVVEGHTDSVGPEAVNQKLSEKRAEAVAEYFETDPVLKSTKFETEGYGYSKPLTSNKTRESRAQNRRVDIVITPTQM